jgi:hypothetical protein
MAFGMDLRQAPVPRYLGFAGHYGRARLPDVGILLLQAQTFRFSLGPPRLPDLRIYYSRINVLKSHWVTVFPASPGMKITG